jgi:hypothetical protein
VTYSPRVLQPHLGYVNHMRATSALDVREFRG